MYILILLCPLHTNRCMIRPGSWSYCRWLQSPCLLSLAVARQHAQIFSLLDIFRAPCEASATSQIRSLSSSNSDRAQIHLWSLRGGGLLSANSKNCWRVEFASPKPVLPEPYWGETPPHGVPPAAAINYRSVCQCRNGIALTHRRHIFEHHYSVPSVHIAL